MFNSTILEVGIGLAFVYLLLSLICSAVVEMVGALPFTNWRGMALNYALENLFRDVWKNDLKKHPLIQGSPPKDKWAIDKWGIKDRSPNKLKNPDYIDPKNFVNALVSVLETRGGGNVKDGIERCVTSEIAAKDKHREY